jgi:hydrogenase maturation factor
MGLLASGSLLITLPEERAPHLLERLRAAGIEAALIGRIVPPEEGRILVHEGRPSPLPRFEQDEVAKLFA